MSKRKRRQFTPVFRKEIVELIRKADEAKKSISDSNLNDIEKQELERLRREVRELRMEREILVKATAFFAKESR